MTASPARRLSPSTVVRTAALLDPLFPPPRNFAIRLWDGTSLPAAGRPTFTLVLNHPAALRRMLRPPVELSLGRAFISRDFDVEGDIFSFFPAVHRFYIQRLPLRDLTWLARQILALPSDGPVRVTGGRGPARLRGAAHSLARDRAAIQYHYDLSPEFFAIWLGRRLQYSCAYFQSGTEDLNTAQERKLAYLCRKLRLEPGQRLLDIGCGFGGLAIYAAENYGVEVLGVTLSQTQADYACEPVERAGLSSRVTIRLQDYRELHSDAFDSVVSVGMFEHVGRFRLPEYFSQVYRLLKPGRIFLNHGISRRAPQRFLAAETGPNGIVLKRVDRPSWTQALSRRVLSPDSFWLSYVFPDGDLVPISQANAVAESAGFEVRDVENLREHYGLTLRRWVEGLESHWDQAVRTTDEVTCRTWRLHLAASAYAFESGELSVNQTLMVKPDDGKSNLPLTRDYMRLPDSE